MAFVEYNFKEIEYNTTNDSCRVVVDIIDDELNMPNEYAFVIGSRQFTQKKLTVAQRNKLIKQLTHAEVINIHKKEKDKQVKVKDNMTKIPNFASVKSLKIDG